MTISDVVVLFFILKHKFNKLLLRCIMKHYKTKCIRAYSILGEKPPQLDSNAEYIIVAKSLYFEHCVVIQRLDGNTYYGEQRWVVPESSMY